MPTATPTRAGTAAMLAAGATRAGAVITGSALRNLPPEAFEFNATGGRVHFHTTVGAARIEPPRAGELSPGLSGESAKNATTRN